SWGSALALLEQGQGGVLDHVFLAADHATAAHFHENLAGRYAVLLLGALGEQQEGAVDTAVAHGQGVLVAADGEVHDRHDQIVGHVLDTEHIHSGLDAHACADRDQNFHRRIAGTGAQASGGGVDAGRARFHRGDGVGYAHGQVMVTVEADLGARLQGRAHRADAGGHVVGQHVAGRVGDVDAVGAVAFHQSGLLGQAFGAVHVGHHQKAHGVHLQLACQVDVLFGHVGLGAVGGHADGVDADLPRHLQVVDGADAGQQQGGNPGLFHQRYYRGQVFLVGVRREAVVHRASAQAVTVGDFDQRDAGLIQASGDALHLLQADLVTLGVHAITQGHVMQSDFLALQVHGAVPHRVAAMASGSKLPSSIFSAKSSAVRAPAAVMMSRLPAYLGRKSPRPSTSMNTETRLPSNTGPLTSL